MWLVEERTTRASLGRHASSSHSSANAWLVEERTTTRAPSSRKQGAAHRTIHHGMKRIIIHSFIHSFGLGRSWRSRDIGWPRDGTRRGDDVTEEGCATPHHRVSHRSASAPRPSSREASAAPRAAAGASRPRRPGGVRAAVRQCVACVVVVRRRDSFVPLDGHTNTWLSAPF